MCGVFDSWQLHEHVISVEILKCSHQSFTPASWDSGPSWNWSKCNKNCPYLWRSKVPTQVSSIPRIKSKDFSHTQFSSSIFRGSVSSSTSSFAFPFFLPFPFPLPLVVAVGGFFSFSVALASTGGARLPRGCSSQQAELEKGIKAIPYPKTSTLTTSPVCAQTHT